MLLLLLVSLVGGAQGSFQLVASASGAYLINGAAGTRTLCAHECGALHGISATFIGAMLATGETDAALAAAIGHGLAVIENAQEDGFWNGAHVCCCYYCWMTCM